MQQAVIESDGLDAYTGLPLRWDLISKYDNGKAQEGKHVYKKSFSDLPTVDHLNDNRGELRFKICSWKVNDSKSDLTLEEFVDLCRAILKFNKRKA